MLVWTRSSAVELSAVNLVVVDSNSTASANFHAHGSRTYMGMSKRGEPRSWSNGSDAGPYQFLIYFGSSTGGALP